MTKQFRHRTSSIILANILAVALCACGSGSAAKSNQAASGTTNVTKAAANSAVSKNSSSAASSTSGKKVSIRVSIGNAMDHPQAIGLQAMADYVSKQSNGNIELKVFPNSQLGAERESVEQVKNGTLEMATAEFGPITTFQKKWKVMDIPWMFDTYDQAWAAMDGPIGDSLKSTVQDSGLYCLAFLENGFRHVTSNVKPITQPSDFKGLKIRTMEAPMQMKTFSTLGASPTPVAWSELYMALSQKIVDAQENPLSNIAEIKLNEVQKYCSLTGHIYGSMVLVTNLNWFNSLPQDYQKIIQDGAQIAMTTSRESNQEKEKTIVAELEKSGMKVNDISADVKAQFRDATQSVIIQAIKDDIGDPDFVDSFMSDVEKVKQEHSSK